jgi:hypothetical protein
MLGCERDDEFETYLKRRVRLDRRLRSLDRLEPPAEFDRLIIAQAREALQIAAPVRPWRAPRWPLPLGMAATILISLSVLLDMGLKEAMQKDATWRPRAEARVSATLASAPAETPVAFEPAPAPIPATAEASPSLSATFTRPSSERTRTLPVRTAPSPPLRRVATAAAAPLQGTASSNTARVASDSSSTASDRDNPRNRIAARVLAASRLRPAPGAYGSGSAEPVEVATPGPDRMEIVTVFGTRIRQVAYPMPDFPADTLEALRGAGPALYVPDLSNLSAENSLDWAAERQRHPNPREWLQHIRKMRAAGLAAKADQELQRFHDAYPAFQALPETPSADGGPR